ncbi:MAG: synthase delta subunit [Chloroflexi bacterium]|nr:synthase delta subunit [Chloroflexota bacterium]
MANLSSARRYAQAIMELGLEHNDLDTWRADLQLLAELWADTGLRAYFEDVRISKAARLQRCREILESRISRRALNMVMMLISRGHTSLIPYIARRFEELERERDQTVVAQVTSAYALTAEERQALTEQLAQSTGKDIQLETRISPAILGGLVIKVGDQLLDLSVVGKLNRMREQVVGRRV